MFSMKMFRNRSSRELVKHCRAISKSTTDKNSDALSRSLQKDNTIQVNLVETGLDAPATASNSSYRKWIKQMQHNNIRALSTIQQSLARPTQIGLFSSKEQSREFMALFPDLVRELTEVGRNQELPEVMKRFAKVLQYNTPNGKKNRGLILVSSYKMLEDPDKLTQENLKLANILGWCVEMMQTHYLMLDDIMDQSDTRRGAPCWYKQKGIGLGAINDALLVQDAVYQLLKKYFKNHPLYISILESFQDNHIKTCLGQSVDSMCLNLDGKPNLDMFTMSRYASMVKFKTAYYSFVHPVTTAMYLAGLSDVELQRQAKTILLEMGEFYQVQDDFLDCFGDPSTTGKQGTDIQEGKCSWLAVMALQRSSPAQRKIMEEHYGRSDPESVATIKKLYEELCLPSTFAIYEEESFNLIKTHIQQISKGLRHDLFFNIMDRIYRRES
ncbi:hypothetical protein ABEB36_006222 [Hypothenemus hampei]|uniref:Farnesyl pyrophosphate synthase n=1 Tax=Hypothenemus hampei TaxID=57062 RepID=A0ABD1EPS6_HYPHA